MCPYVKVNNYRDFPICSKNGSICSMMRRCTDRMMWMPLSSMDNCKLRNKIDIPKGAYKVLFKKNGNLYVEYKDKNIIIKYDKEDTPEYVYITNRNGIFKIKENKIDNE